MANKELMVTLGLDASSYTQNVKRAKDLNKELDSSFKLMSSSSDKFEKSIQGLGKKQEYLSQKIKVANKLSEEHIKRIQESEKALKDAQAKMKEYQDAIDNNSGSLKANTQLLDKARKAVYENERRILDAQKSYNETQKSVQEFSREIELTTQELNAMKADEGINNIKNDIKGLDESFDFVKNSVADFDKTMEGLSLTQEYYTERTKESEKLLDAYNTEMTNSKNVISEYEEKVSGVSKKLEIWEKRLEGLKSSEPNYESTVKKVEELRQKYSQMNQVVEFHKNRVDTLGKEYNATEQDIAKMAGALDANSKKMKKMNDSITFEKADAKLKEFTNVTITKLEKELTKLNDDFEILTTTVNGYETSVTGLKAKQDHFNKSLDIAQKTFKEYSTELGELKTKISALEKEQGELENSIEGYIKELKNLDGKEWDKQAKKIESAKKRYEEVNQSLDKHRKRLDKVEAGYKESRKSVAQLSTELRNTKRQMAEVNQQKVFDNLDDKIKASTEKIKLLESQFKLTASTMNNFKNSKAELEAKTELYKNKVEELTKQIGNMDTKLKETKSVMDDYKEKQEQTKKSIDELRESMKAMDKESPDYREAIVELTRLETEYEQLGQEINRHTSDYNRLQAEINETTADMNNLTREAGQLRSAFAAQRFEDFGSSMQKVGQSITSIGQALMPASLAIGGMGAGVVAVGKDFKQSMSQVQAIMGETGGSIEEQKKRFDELTTSARNNAKITTFSAKEAADGLQYLALAGYSSGQAMNTLPSILALAQAGAMELSLASDLATDSISSLGHVGDSAVAALPDYLDKVAMASTRSNTSIEQLMKAYVKVGGQVDNMNISLDTSAAMLGVLANRGIKAEEAGVSLNSILINFTKAGGESAKALKELGVSAFDSNGKIKTMEQFILELAGSLKKLPQKDQIQLINMIGGKTQAKTLQKLMQGMVDDTGKLSEEYVKLKSEIEKAPEMSALEKMSETMTDTLQGDMKIFISQLQESMLVIYDEIEPMLREFVKGLTEKLGKLTEWFSNLDKGSQKFIIKIAAVAAALPPLLIVLGSMTNGLGALSSGIGKSISFFSKFTSSTGAAQGAVSAASSGIKIFGATISGMTVAIGAAIAALVAVVTAIGQNENALAWLQEEWGAFGLCISTVCESISGVVKATFGTVGEFLKMIGKSIAALVKGKWRDIDDIWSEGLNNIKNTNKEAWSDIKAESSRALNQIRNASKEELSSVEKTFDEALKVLPNITKDNLGNVAKEFTGKVKDLSDDSLLILRGTSETMSSLFYGISEGMDTERINKKLESNMEALLKSGKLTAGELEKDFKEAQKLIADNMANSFKRVKNQANDVIRELERTSIKGVNGVSEGITNLVTSMNEETFKELKSLDDDWKSLFAGLENTTEMSSEEINKVILGNLTKLNLDSNEKVNEFCTKLKTGLDTAKKETKESSEQLVEETTTAIEETLSESNKGVEGILSAMKEKTDLSMRDFAGVIAGHIKEMGYETAKELSTSTDAWYQLLHGAYDKNGKMSENFVETLIANFRTLNITTPEQMQEYCKNLEDGFKKANIQVTTEAEKTANTVKEKGEEIVKASSEVGMEVTKNVTPENLEQKVTEAMTQAENGLNSKKEAFAEEARKIAEEAENKFRQELENMQKVEIPDSVLNVQKIQEEMGMAGALAAAAFAKSWNENDHVIVSGFRKTFSGFGTDIAVPFNMIKNEMEMLGIKIGVVGDAATKTKGRIQEIGKVSFNTLNKSAYDTSKNFDKIQKSADSTKSSVQSVANINMSKLNSTLDTTSNKFQTVRTKSTEAKTALETVAKVSFTNNHSGLDQTKTRLENLKKLADMVKKAILDFINLSFNTLLNALQNVASRFDTIKSRAESARSALANVNSVSFNGLINNLSNVNKWLNNIKNTASSARSTISGIRANQGGASAQSDGYSMFSLNPSPISTMTLADNVSDFVSRFREVDMRAYQTSGGFYSPSSMSVGSSRAANHSNADNSELVNALVQQNQLLMQLLSNNTIQVGVNVDGRQIAKASAKYMEDEINFIKNRKARLGGF